MDVEGILHSACSVGDYGSIIAFTSLSSPRRLVARVGPKQGASAAVGLSQCQQQIGEGNKVV